MDSRTSDRERAGVPHEVLSAVSHELRGPLGVARGYLRMLETQPDADPRVLATVQHAARATARMAEVLDDLSEYTRWVRGEHALAMAPVPLRQVLDAAAGAATVPLTPRIALEVDAPASITATADSARLARAIAALVTAMARAQAQDETLVLALRALDDGRAALRVVPHRLLDTATTERPVALGRAGAGLSLALADLIVQRPGGRLLERWAGEEWAGYVCVL